MFILYPRLQRQIVYACVSPKAKLFSLQLNNQSKILFRRFLPFALSFQLCSGFVGPQGSSLGPIATVMTPSLLHYAFTLRSASEIVSKLLFTHKKFCFKQVRYLYKLK